MAIELKNRKDMDPAWMWDLSPLFADRKQVEDAIASVREQSAKLAARQGNVAEDPRGVIRDFYAMMRLMDRLIVYTGLYRDEDASDPVRQELSERVNALAGQTMAATAFINPELLTLPEETLKEMQQDPDFSDYSEALRLLLLEKPHTLPAEQEALLASASEALSAAHDVFSKFNDVDLPLPTVKNEDGEEVRLTHAGYGLMLRSANREVRRAAYLGMHEAYAAFGSTLTAAYAGSVKKSVFLARARHYESARQSKLAPLEIPETVYDNLLTEVDNALPALHDYLHLRKKALKLDEMHLYDLYTPMVESAGMKLTYPEAFETVCEGLQPLGEDYIAKLREAYAQHWIDVYENKSKRSGAYSWSCYDAHPYVLLNFIPSLDGAMTLAHELGHAMHSFYSTGNQCYAKHDYSLFVAEVASTCNEVLLIRHLIDKHSADTKLSAFLLNELLESFRTTVFRQTMFAAFEKESHAMYERGEALTQDALKKVYYKLNEKYYGNGCVVDQVVENEWMRIPHFYRDFYVYQYATGFSAAVAIAYRILKEGEPAVKDYRKFLSAGCSVPPIEALRYAGVDMEKPDTVRSALRVFADTVKELADKLGLAE